MSPVLLANLFDPNGTWDIPRQGFGHPGGLEEARIRETLYCALSKTGWTQNVHVLCSSPTVEEQAKWILIEMVKDLANRMRAAEKSNPIRLVKDLAGLLVFGSPNMWTLPEPKLWVAIGFTAESTTPGWLREKLG